MWLEALMGIRKELADLHKTKGTLIGETWLCCLLALFGILWVSHRTILQRAE